MKEVWKQIVGYAAYEISSHGRVRSFFKNAGYYTGSIPDRNAKPRILKGRLGSTGYLQVQLGRKSKNQSIHRLVAKAFLEPLNEKQIQVGHLDNNKLNNRIKNLQWVTPKENNAHKNLHGTHFRGERNPAAKLTEKQVQEIRNYPYIRGSGVILAKKYNISTGHISTIRKCKKWAHSK